MMPFKNALDFEKSRPRHMTRASLEKKLRQIEEAVLQLRNENQALRALLKESADKLDYYEGQARPLGYLIDAEERIENG